MRSVAIVGGGPSGLVAARWLKHEGFTPTVFEQGDGIGGQWSGEPGHSGIWPAMRTNTTRTLTSFSDLRHGPGTSLYPHNQDVRAYLARYAQELDLVPHLRTRSRVQEIARDRDGWRIRFSTDGTTREEVFSRVVLASGRYNKPAVAPVPGLESFTGAGGIVHTFGYKQPERYRGLRVVVAGGSISALEIACDLAMLGAARVVTTYRRQRYVLPKLSGGVPSEFVAFTRFGALAAESLPLAVVGQSIKELILRTNGNPESFGALPVDDDVFTAGITLCQHFLPLVAEGRVAVKPWIRAIDGKTVRFSDGSEEEADALLFGTGFDLHLPFLSADVRRTLDVDAHHLDLHDRTFHPDLPGFACLGLFDLAGPYFPVLEQQARWIAYSWSGTRPEPSRDEMTAGVAAYRALRGTPQQMMMNSAALLFARRAGVEPELAEWPGLARALLFGPLSPISFRLSGPDRLPDAAERLAEEAREFGLVPAPELSAEQRAQLEALAGARQDPAFARFVSRLGAP